MYIIHLILHNFSLVAQLIVTLSDPDLHMIHAHVLAYGMENAPLFESPMKPQVPSWFSGETR